MTELTEAAERLRRLFRGDPPGAIYGRHTVRQDTFENLERNDVRFLADAYLTEHPADDDEPITMEWIENFPDFDLECASGKITGGFSLGAGGICYCDIFQSDDEIQLVCETRGDVRTLYRAFGEPPKETSE